MLTERTAHARVADLIDVFSFGVARKARELQAGRQAGRGHHSWALTLRPSICAMERKRLNRSRRRRRRRRFGQSRLTAVSGSVASVAIKCSRNESRTAIATARHSVTRVQKTNDGAAGDCGGGGAEYCSARLPSFVPTNPKSGGHSRCPNGDSNFAHEPHDEQQL